jgi:ketosteroid isomerase-like protein
MTKLTTLLASTLVLSACSKKAEESSAQRALEAPGTQRTAAPPAPTKPLAGRELADKHIRCIELINASKLEDFKHTCAANRYLSRLYKLHDHGDLSERSRDEMLAWLTALKAGLPDLALEPQLVMVSDRTLLSIELVTGTHTAPLSLPGLTGEPTNKRIGLLMFHRIAVDDADMAAEEWSYADPLTLAGQLGLAPRTAPAVRPPIETGIEGAPVIVVSENDDTEKTTIALVDRRLEALSAGKLGDAMASFAGDAVESDQSLPADGVGAATIEAGSKRWLDAFKDVRYTRHDTWAAGNYVVQTGRFNGLHDKALGPIKRTGKPVEIEYAEVFRIEGGKIVQLWRFHSGLVLAMQLGLVTPPAPAPAPAPSASTPAPSASTPAPSTPAPAPSAAPASATPPAPAPATPASSTPAPAQ